MTVDLRPTPDLQSVFPGDSEMAVRCRECDWTSTPIGPPSDWDPALRVAVRATLESPFAINLWCGPELTLIYNDAYRTVLGAKHPRALGRPGPEVWGEIWNEIEPIFRRIREGGASAFAEDARFLMERASGPPGEAYFTFSVSPVRNDDGGIVAFLNIAAETTQRVRAEQETRAARAAAEAAEGRLRAVFAQAPAFLAVLRGPDHIFEFTNDAYLQLIGHRNVIGMPVRKALPEVQGQGFFELLDKVYDSGEPFIGREIPVMLQRSAGKEPEQLYLDFVYQPLMETGEQAGIVAHGADVTQAVKARRETERLLAESESARTDAELSEARYRFLANAIPVHVWTGTPEGALDYVSDRAAAYLGRTPDQIVGEGWLHVLHPDDVTPTIDRWKRSLETGEPYEIEFRLWSAADNRYRWYLGRATPQRDENGQIIRWFGTNTDIEESKQAQAELKRLTDEALEANRAKSDFLAAMSHDLRTPLNAIGGYAQLIEMGVRGPVTEEQRTDLLKIQRSKNHLDRLVSDVLSFAKLGAGRLELRVTELDVRTILGTVVDIVTPQLAEKELTLAPLNVPPGVKVFADIDKTRQILINLLANALKFTPAGGRIAVEVKDGGSSVAISVIDTGIGVPEDQLERIFEPFAQAKRALQAADAGVGLGLAISRQLARAMDGDLTVQSVAGKGSTFTLTLPKPKAAA
ncbi:MAG TPA: PAS domain-containing protein [Gemmatimonadaceae bacterium]|nr:PAS domain-containing protein [Gemmatimonadaceae bacterium]